MKRWGTILLCLTLAVTGCKEDDPEECTDTIPTINPNATAYDLVIPPFFPPMPIPGDNPLTVEGVELGRHLFWEPLLSGNNAMSCGTCHQPDLSFAESTAVSTGVFGDQGDRNAMALVNLGWAPTLAWDGSVESLEAFIGDPIENPIEMADNWTNALAELEATEDYPPLFDAAFGSPHITEERVRKAMASFLRTMISGGSKFDLERIGLYTYNESEERGHDLYLLEGGEPNFGADCFHCHGFGSSQFTDYSFRNNGLDSIFDDPGHMAVTGDPLDEGKFKVPTLRNIELTAPYMHDGRFNTLEEVVEHYNSGVVPSTTLDPFMKFEEGLQLTDQDKADLVNFLKCLTDPDFTTNEDFSDPHE